MVAGSEFISAKFIGALRDHKTKLRPNRARSPHLNGKVERSQQSDRAEFYALEITGKGKQRRAKEKPEVLATKLSEWQRFYNEERPHGGIKGRTPEQRWQEVKHLTPAREEMDARYDPASEPTQVKRGKWRWITLEE